ncbi:hypothetical protein I4U23_007269 [Adineta vaga]|nr:hypothetical protein I4U23_007269 [Adineta vaga]
MRYTYTFKSFIQFFEKSIVMAQSTEESVLNTLLKTRYPLTYYLSRQQQFSQVYSTTQTAAVAAAPTPPPASDLFKTAIHKRKTPLPPPACFNVPDTLDFNATGYDQNDEMDQSSGIEDEGAHDYDETLLLKNISNQLNDSNSDYTNEKYSSIIQRSSVIDLEFSPYENNSPLQKAIQNGLNIINK